ncbi:hypothetical protein F5Y17DRAFT_460830 [Xylariaceae sp. FL0594]|nr:hypothetical protein F5Y17DRAFT_460830 [Xylariaceae sp. FL0594]
MYSPPHQIRRVPVPVRQQAPAPVGPLQIAAHTSAPSPNVPSAAATVIVQGQPQPRAPIALVNTHSRQLLLPAHDSTRSSSHDHSSHAIQMEWDAESGRYALPYALPRHVEDDIKAAVMTSIPATKHLEPPGARATNRFFSRKVLRLLSLSWSILIVIEEIAASILVGITDDLIFTSIWVLLLSAWNIWCLFRLRKKANGEVISYWQLGGEITFAALTLFLTVFVIRWTLFEEGYIYFRYWRAVVACIAFSVWLVLQTTILILTVIELWKKHNNASTPQPINDEGQPPHHQIIVQYIPSCPHCHMHVEPQPGDEINAHLATIGDLQPQAVAPAYTPPKEDRS